MNNQDRAGGEREVLTDVQAVAFKERKRAVDICYAEMDKHCKAYINKVRAGNDLAFIENGLADECRLMGNAISGGNALSAALGESMEDRIREEYPATKDAPLYDKMYNAIMNATAGLFEESVNYGEAREKAATACAAIATQQITTLQGEVERYKSILSEVAANLRYIEKGVKYTENKGLGVGPLSQLRNAIKITEPFNPTPHER